MGIKTRKRGATHTLHIMFKNGKLRTYHVYRDNTALNPIIVWSRSGFPVPKFAGFHSGKMKKITGLQYLLLSDKLWEFTHSKGSAVIRTGEIAEISVEIGIMDPSNNPLSQNDHYDNPLN